MKSSGEVSWSVGEVAERFGMPTHVLRHWESEGLLEPDRDHGGRRRYDRDDVTRVAAIRRQKDAGMSLEQIRVLLDADAPRRHAVLAINIQGGGGFEIWQFTDRQPQPPNPPRATTASVETPTAPAWRHPPH